MATLTAVSASSQKTGKSFSLNYDFGANCDEMIDKYTAPVVFEFAKAQMIVRLQARIRALLDKGSDPKLAEDWKPGVTSGRVVDSFAEVQKQLAAMDPKERAAYIKKLSEGLPTG